jgi:DNA-directed RNA polymerase subunit M/transcription elongation factor TFIIS
MVDVNMPECIECKSSEVVAHTHDVTARGETGRTYLVTYECVECGRQWRPITELTGQSRRPLRRYS